MATTSVQQKKVPWACVIALAVGLGACGGGGGGSSDTTTTDTLSDTEARAFQVPSEVSAVPVSDSSAGGSPGLARAVRSLQHARALQTVQNLDGSASVSLDDSSDYMNAVPRKYVEIPALDEAFSIIGEVLSALKQTQYWDDAVLNQGPYVAMIGWEESDQGQTVKEIEKWTIDATYDANATNPYASTGVFTVKVWVPGETEGEFIRALFTIYKGATTDEATGEVTDFGIWDMNVKFNSEGTEYFLATARVAQDGRPQLRMAMNETEDFGDQVFTYNMKAFLSRSADGSDGYGKVFMPTFDDQACGDPNNPPAPGTNCTVNQYMPYAFNSAYVNLGVDANGDGDTQDTGGGDQEVILDRAQKAEITHRYGVFYAAASGDIKAGDNVMKHLQFGFPVFADVSDGNGGTDRRYGYYGAWRGEHNLWGLQTCDQNGCSSLADGSTVTREEWTGSGRTTTDYTVKTVDGALSKRELETADVTDVKDTPARVFLNKHFNLTFDAAADLDLSQCKGFIFRDPNDQSVRCEFLDFSTNPPTPQQIALTAFDGWDILKQANWTNGFVERNGAGPLMISYLTQEKVTQMNFALGGGLNAPIAEGLYEVDFQSQQVVAAYTPQAGDIVRMDASADVWLVLKDEGASATDGLNLAWYAKTVTGGPQWEPEFAPDNQDTVFGFPDGEQVRIEVGGNMYMVSRKPGTQGTSAADYAAFVENQSTLTLDKQASTFLPTGTAYLSRMDDFNHTVRLSWDATLGALVIVGGEADVRSECVGADQDGNGNKVYTCNEWGLVAIANAGDAADYTNDYPVDGEGVKAVDANNNICNFPGQVDCTTTAVQFMYRYNANGAQTYLMAGDTPMVLSDPVTLTAVPLVDVDGVEAGTRTLRFDGFMQGLSNFGDDFRKGEFDDFLSKIRNVKYVADKVTLVDGNVGAQSGQFLIKPLETSVFFKDVSADNGLTGLPDMASGQAVDLDAETGAANMPDVADNTMADVPTGDTVAVEFIEGVPVE